MLGILYLLGTVLMHARLLRRVRIRERIPARASPLYDPGFQELYGRLVERVHLRVAPVVAYSREVLRPTVAVVPGTLSSLEDAVRCRVSIGQHDEMEEGREGSDHGDEIVTPRQVGRILEQW